jgi:hypothetical protein
MGVQLTASTLCWTLRNFLTPEPSCHGTEFSTVWDRKDGATAHAAGVFMEVVWGTVPEHVICLCGELPWPARSPDLFACDYFLSAYFKAKMHTTKTRSSSDCMIAIRGKNFQRYQKNRETYVQSWKSVYTIIINILMIRSSKLTVVMKCM